MANDRTLLLGKVAQNHLQPASEGTCEERIRRALMEHTYSCCCSGATAAREMVFDEIRSTYSHRYIVETYAELRSFVNARRKYRIGEQLSYTQPQPHPDWDVYVTPVARMFTDSKDSIDIPGTAYLEKCLKCVGSGFSECRACNGLGKKICTSCNNGWTREFGHGQLCTWCNGRGTTTFNCFHCDGLRMVSCKECDRSGYIKHLTQLIVTRRTYRQQFLTSVDGLPQDLLLKVTGPVVFKEEDQKVNPITGFPDERIKNASVRLLRGQEVAASREKILMQRQTVIRLPVAVVSYTWKSSSSRFFVYGAEDRVYAPDYPDGCNCCVIL